MKLHLATTALMLSATTYTVCAERVIRAASPTEQNTKSSRAQERSLYYSSTGAGNDFGSEGNGPTNASFRTQQAPNPSSPTDQSGFVGLGTPPNELPSRPGIPFGGRTEGDSFEGGGDFHSGGYPDPDFDGYGPGPGDFGGPLSNDGFIGTGPPPDQRFDSHEDIFGAGYGVGYGSGGPLFFEDEREFGGAGPGSFGGPLSNDGFVGTGPPPGQGFASQEEVFGSLPDDFFPDGGIHDAGYGVGYGSGGPPFFEGDSDFGGAGPPFNIPQDSFFNGGSDGAGYSLEGPNRFTDSRPPQGPRDFFPDGGRGGPDFGLDDPSFFADGHGLDPRRGSGFVANFRNGGRPERFGQPVVVDRCGVRGGCGGAAIRGGGKGKGGKGKSPNAAGIGFRTGGGGKGKGKGMGKGGHKR